MKHRKPLSSQTRVKNRAFLIILLLLVALFFTLSIIRMRENVHVNQAQTIRLHK